MATFTNRATLSYGDTTTNSNIVTGELLAVLSASKTAVGTSYRPGDRITHIIRITNSGSAPLSNLTITDNLGAYPFGNTVLVPLTYAEGSVQFFIDGIPAPAPSVAVDTSLVFSDLTVPAGSSAMLLYETLVNAYAPAEAGGTVTNTAQITADCLFTPLEASETITAASSAVLILSKSICPAAVTECDLLTYTFVIQNIGTSPACEDDGAVITDTFDPILSDISVTYNGIPWTAPENYTYDALSGLFATVPGQITVPAATYSQDPTTGHYIMTPGVATVQVSGTVI